MNTFCIFGSGEYGDTPPHIPDGAFVIAADGGLAKLCRMGRTPELILGDFDSYDGGFPEGVELLRHPVMKDATDMELAVHEAVRRGAERVIIYGGMGGRMDHTFANIQLLVKLARENVASRLVGPRWTATAISNESIDFDEGRRGLISVFAYGGDAVVTETGLLYGLDHSTLRDDKPLGVSNQFTGRPAKVTVHSGLCVVMWENIL